MLCCMLSCYHRTDCNADSKSPVTPMSFSDQLGNSPDLVFMEWEWQVYFIVLYQRKDPRAPVPWRREFFKFWHHTVATLSHSYLQTRICFYRSEMCTCAKRNESAVSVSSPFPQSKLKRIETIRFKICCSHLLPRYACAQKNNKWVRIWFSKACFLSHSYPTTPRIIYVRGTAKCFDAVTTAGIFKNITSHSLLLKRPALVTLSKSQRGNFVILIYEIVWRGQCIWGEFHKILFVLQ